MAYSLAAYSKTRLTFPISKRCSTIDDAIQNIKWWFEVKRNNQATQFLVIDEDDTIVKILTKEDCSG